jgi:hypothetical protein
MSTLSENVLGRDGPFQVPHVGASVTKEWLK